MKTLVLIGVILNSLCVEPSSNYIPHHITMGQYKKDITPVHSQRSYVFLTITHWYETSNS